MHKIFWASSLFRRWRKTGPGPQSAHIDFSAQLRVSHDDDWVSLELLLANRSNFAAWVEHAAVVLYELAANSQASISMGQARHQVLQNVSPHDALRVSLAGAIYDAAGRPQGPYSCLVHTNVRYRVLHEWFNTQLEPCRVEMAALTVIDLQRSRWYDKKIKHIKGQLGLKTNEHIG